MQRLATLSTLAADKEASRSRVSAGGCVANGSNEQGPGTDRSEARAQETASLSH